MNARGWMALGILLAGCGDSTPPAESLPKFELRDVVEPRLAAAGPAPVAATPPPPSEDQLEEWRALLDTLAAPRASLREQVLADLVSRGAVAVPWLTQVAADTSAEAGSRAAALEVLAGIDTPEAAEALVVGLEKDPEPWVRSNCAFRLAASRHDRFLPRMLLRLRYESDDETAVWIGDTLARRGNHSGIDGMLVVRARAKDAERVAWVDSRLAELARAVGAPDALALAADWASGELERRHPAPPPSEALQREIWSLIRALSEWDLRVVDDRRFVLSHMNAWVVAPLCETLHENDVYRRLHAAQCLERMGERAFAAVPVLIEALTEPRLAPGAAAALGAIRNPSARTPLERTLRAADLDLACASARALGRLGDTAAAGPLLEAFAPERSADLRQAAAESLLELGSPQALPFLIERLTAPRSEAVSAEAALQRWLARQAASSDPAVANPFAARLEAWRRLDDLPAGAIATSEQLSQRLQARAGMARGW